MFIQDSVLNAAETSEAVTCDQPLQACSPSPTLISPPLKKRKTPRYEVEEPARTVLQDSLVTPKCEPEEIIEDICFADVDETYSSDNNKPELISISKNSVSENSSKCSSAQNLQRTHHIKGEIKLYWLFIIIIHYLVRDTDLVFVCLVFQGEHEWVEWWMNVALLLSYCSEMLQFWIIKLTITECLNF